MWCQELLCSACTDGNSCTTNWNKLFLQLIIISQDQLDKLGVALRNACRDDELDLVNKHNEYLLNLPKRVERKKWWKTHWKSAESFQKCWKDKVLGEQSSCSRDNRTSCHELAGWFHLFHSIYIFVSEKSNKLAGAFQTQKNPCRGSQAFSWLYDPKQKLLDYFCP